MVGLMKWLKGDNGQSTWKMWMERLRWKMAMATVGGCRQEEDMRKLEAGSWKLETGNWKLQGKDQLMHSLPVELGKSALRPDTFNSSA